MTHNKKRGFTLVELNLAMIFVAMLLMGVAALTLHVARLYQRGALIKDVNYIGRDVMSVMRRDMAESTTPAQRVVTPQSGRVCLGNVSYIFNTVRGVHENDRNRLIVRGNGTSTDPPIALVRITDPTRKWCDTSTVIRNVTEAEFSSGVASELISRDQYATIAVHAINVQPIDTYGVDDALALHNLEVWLGTSDVSSLDLTNNSCAPPTSSSVDFESCFVVDYTTIIKAGGF